MSEAIQRGASHPLGATPVPGGVNFSVYSEDATALELLLFGRLDDPTPARVIALGPGQHRTYHYWHAFVPNLGAGQLYAWRAHGPAAPSPRLRFDPSKALLDPYGRGVAVSTGYDRMFAAAPGNGAGVAMKSIVVDPSTYDLPSAGRHRRAGQPCPFVRRALPGPAPLGGFPDRARQLV
jgi:glycogen operon protein